MRLLDFGRERGKGLCCRQIPEVRASPCFDRGPERRDPCRDSEVIQSLDLQTAFILLWVRQQHVRVGQRCHLWAVTLTPVTVPSLMKQLKQELQEGNLGKISFPLLYITQSPWYVSNKLEHPVMPACLETKFKWRTTSRSSFRNSG